MASTSPPPQGYLFGTDTRASARLNYQHFLTKQRLQYLLHPHIRLQGPGRRIADVGAGTCIWSIELCQQYPDVHFDCFDITADQFPAKNLLPHNISVHEHDAFQAFPEHLRGTYDVVHVQMFLTIVKNGNPAPLIKNFMTLLKPGGWLYWVDVDSKSVRAVIPKETPMLAPATRAMATLLKHPPSYDASWTSKLDTYFTQEGLLESTLEHCVVDPLFTSLHNVHLLLVLEDHATATLDPDSMKAKALQAGIARTATEMKSGAAILNDYVVALGRKVS
ncbi:hypothetical protein MMC19_001403 [Ptychographa xylographoides]|nr:hypothetical protein [Ptychographa xylographoides]